MPLYECVFIARQDVSSAQVDTLIDTFAALIKDGGGEVKKREYWGLRNLAYRIRKNRKGHFVLLNIDSPSPAVIEMERTMRLNEDILRYLTVRVEALEEGQSAIMQRRDERGDRDRDRDRFDRGPRRRDAPPPGDAPAGAEPARAGGAA